MDVFTVIGAGGITLARVDWVIIISFFIITIGIGVAVAKVSSKSNEEFFVGGRNMPWWLLGFSMVATTFSTDTPNLVTDLVRQYGVFGNWIWWAMLPTGMLTVFLYSRLWRRSGTVTDLEFYELRYSGKSAAFLRGFRAIYLGLLFNVLIMASVSLAAIKIGATMLGLEPWQSVTFAMIATVLFSAIGGFRGVLLTDFFLFIISMIGSIGAAWFVLKMPEIGGISGMVEQLRSVEETAMKLDVMSYSSRGDLIAMFIVPFALIWWSIWYPGAEPGGGGYLVQRMLAAKNENHALGATLFFNVAHYALRPWPWLLVALASMIMYPTVESMAVVVGDVLPADQIKDDVAYSLMLTKLPAGWIGLVLTSLVAAYMSTISTHLNWGSSYLVNDVWLRFYRPKASQRELVWMGRLFTVILMVLAGWLALRLSSAMATFKIMLSIGAGTGLLFMLRWFWWRINAAAEIVAMVASFTFAVLFEAGLKARLELNDWQSMAIQVALTTLCWLLAAYFGPETDKATLRRFCAGINPGGFWGKVFREAEAEGAPINVEHAKDSIPLGILAAVFGCFGVYAALFGTGEFIYGRTVNGVIAAVVMAVSATVVYVVWTKINIKKEV